MSHSITLQERQAIVDEFVTGEYVLPTVSGKKVFYIIPLSGGIDSFTVGHVLLARYPNTKFTFINADTGFEADGTEEALELFESITEKNIVRIKPKHDLLTMIEKSGNFLPSQRQRSCTGYTKTIPIKRLYQQLREMHGEDAVFIQFVGLRFDEATREGITWKEDYIASAYPLQALGLTKSCVNKIVERIQGIPRYYQEKSRSGCKMCIFSRRSEIIDAWKQSPADLTRAANMEEIPTNTLRVYNEMPTTVSEITGTARNWLSYYRPSRLNNPTTGFEGERGKNRLNDSIGDLFGASDAKKLYVAVEYQYHGGYGGFFEPQVYFEKMITYSTSLGGIKTALKHFWLHRLHTKELYNSSEEELTGARQVQILEIEVDDYDYEIPPKPDGVFTWQNDRTPLFAIKKTVAVIERILLTEGLKQDLKSANKQIKQIANDLKPMIENAKCYGRILSSMEYCKPTLSDLVDDIVITEAPVACMSCSR
ncbi:MAG: hypothetical protein HRU38_06945 [Saccharospirillaceae bacterium]|nr:hypothetical protein [Saccharospirillaceae bacterium]